MKILARLGFGGSGPDPQLSAALSWLCFLAAAMSLIALAKLPYGYYTALRIVVCGVGAVTGLTWGERGALVPAALLLVLAIAFNPLVPLHLQRDTWKILNIAAACVLTLSGLGLQSHAVKARAQGRPDQHPTSP